MSTVVVACKVPNGVNLGEVTIPGPKPIPPGLSAELWPKRPGGYEITKGISAKAWEKWAASHADSPLLTNCMLYAHENYGVVVNWARAHRDARSGLEQGPTQAKY